MPHEGCAVSLRIEGTTADCGKLIVGSRLFSYGQIGLWVQYCEAHRGVVDRLAAGKALTLSTTEVPKDGA